MTAVDSVSMPVDGERCLRCGNVIQHAVAFCPYCGIQFVVQTAAPTSAPPSPPVPASKMKETPQQAPPPAAASTTVITPQEVPLAPKTPQLQQKASTLPPAAAKNKLVRYVFPALVLVILALVFLPQLGQKSQQDTQSSAGDPAVQSITRYVNRADASARAGTSASERNLGPLRRGDEVHGVWVSSKTGYQWLQLTDGPHAGGYIFGPSLSVDPRLPCSETLELYAEPMHDAQIYSAANPSSLTVGSIAAHKSVYAACRVEADWIEIRLAHGGVGYSQA
ncbi:MAG: hypothetical protein ACREMY_32610, partial [bacterium]